MAHESMTLSELAKITGPPEHKAAGASSVIDPIGVAAAQRANLALAVLDGRQPAILEAALSGTQFDGTRIYPD
jgi:uridylate kinase